MLDVLRGVIDATSEERNPVPLERGCVSPYRVPVLECISRSSEASDRQDILGLARRTVRHGPGLCTALLAVQRCNRRRNRPSQAHRRPSQGRPCHLEAQGHCSHWCRGRCIDRRLLLDRVRKRWSGWATATGAPITADAANPAPAAAKSEVMIRDLVARIARLFSTARDRQGSA